METRTKLFAVSDIHGNGTLFEKALQDSHFEPNNPTHLLVVCGDLFDRGRENRKVYDILMRIPNKVLILGNHDIALKRILENKRFDKYDIYNGADITIKEFFGNDSVDSNGRITLDQRVADELKSLVDSSVDYFETYKYVFVHGWIPASADADPEFWQREWRSAPLFVWNEFRFAEWYTMYRHRLTLPNKTIVCGHRSAAFGSYFSRKRSKEDTTPFYAKNMIAIDGETVYSGRVNVVVLEDTLLETKEYEMSLNDEYFTAVKDGRKTVELRVRDEKRKALRSGDRITFSKKSDPMQKLFTRVKGCYLYEDFECLTEDFTVDEFGFHGRSKESVVKLANEIYGREKVKKYGALAIKLELLEDNE